MSITVAVVVVIVVASLSSAARPTAQALPAGEGLRTWLDAVAQHRPGEVDAGATLAASWTGADLERLLPSLLAYVDNARRRESADPPRVTCNSCEHSKVERDRLLFETRPRFSNADRALIQRLSPPERLNDLIQRAVILHADAVMRVQRDPTRRVRSAGAPNVLRAPSRIATTVDGEYVGTATDSPHWFIARALLDFVTPEPALDAHTRRWYLAAGAYMAATSDFAQLWPHLQKMEALFPKDAAVAFDLGWRAEVNSTARGQAHLQALLDAATDQRKGGMRGAICMQIPCDDARNPYGIKRERESLIDAERHYARAVDLDPTLIEARVRLAHTRTRLGKHAEAEAALRNLPAADDPFVVFYEALVRGMTLEGRGRLDEAAAAYQRGLALAPHAPSANLALSALERQRGDTALSLAYARRAIEPPANNTAGVSDPFALYHLGRGRNVGKAWAAYFSELGL